MQKFQLKLSLDNHKISKKQRSKMIDWIIEVLSIFNQGPRTVFRAILLLELFLKKTKRSQGVADLHLLGVVCMFLASKQEEVRILKFKSVFEDICKFKFTRQQILEKEREVCSVLRFNLNAGTMFEYTTSLFSLLDLPKPFAESVRKYSILLQKMFLFSYNIMNVYRFEELAVYSTIISMKLFEHSNPGFSSLKSIQKILKLSGVDKSQILDNLNFLRDYASDFQQKFPFNNLQINGESTAH